MASFFRIGFLSVSCLCTVLSSPLAWGDINYVFRDANGDAIEVPTNIPIHSEESPGSFKNEVQSHTPITKTKTRKEGLELIRFVQVAIPHPFKETNPVKAVYAVDKDGLVIGYQAFSPKDKNLTAEFKINGVINYVVIYVECSKHELWRKSFRI